MLPVCIMPLELKKRINNKQKVKYAERRGREERQ